MLSKVLFIQIPRTLLIRLTSLEKYLACFGPWIFKNVPGIGYLHRYKYFLRLVKVLTLLARAFEVEQVRHLL
jgi:hypothetical protein